MDERAVERLLLFWSACAVVLGFLMLWTSRILHGEQLAPIDTLPLGLYLASLAVLHFSFVAVRFQGDQFIVVVIAFLSGLGLLTQYRMGSFDSEGLVSINLLLYPGGLISMGLIAITLRRGRFEFLAGSHWAWVWGVGSLGLLAVMLVIGERYRGGVYAAGLTTPTEILKVTVVLLAASLIYSHLGQLRKPRRAVLLARGKHIASLLTIWLVMAALLTVHRDLGLLFILSVSLLLMVSLGVGSIAYLIYGTVFGGLVGVGLLQLLPHGSARLQAWLNPFHDPTGSSWQILQGLSGMYSGGLWGDGFGRGSPEYTPIARSDFIYAALSEELGFTGAVIVVTFFVILFVRMLSVIASSRSEYGRLVSIGIFGALISQTLLNIGGVTKTLPLTGVPLPFFSHGGSSVLTTFIAVGLVLAISDQGLHVRRT